MAKKPVISKEAQVLLKLLRIALGTEPRKYFGEVVEPFPEGIDWKEVVRLSYEHKVSAIAVDGLEASKYDPYKGLDEKQTEELKAVLVPWIKDVENTEWSYCYYVEVLKTLCQIFRDNGLTPIILKGYGLSLNYPRPSHRGAGDIDLFLVDRDGRPAAEEGDRVLRQFAVEHTFEGIAPHHTHFEFKGITIENHHEVADPKWGTKEEKQFIATLKDLLLKDSRPLTGVDGAMQPSYEFNVLYQILHIFNHAFDFGATMRQLCDFCCSLKKCEYSIDLEMVNSIIRDAKFDDFFNGLKRTIHKYLNSQPIDIAINEGFNGIECYLMFEIFHKDGTTVAGIRNIDKYYRNRWYYRYYRKENWLVLTIRHALSNILKIS